MLGKSHAFLGAVTTGLGLTAFADVNIFQNSGLFVGGMVLGTFAALLPDMDSQHNFLRSSLGVGSSQTRIRLHRIRRKGPLEMIFFFFKWVIARFLDVVDWILPHRGPTHWGVTAGLLTAGVWLISKGLGGSDVWWMAFGLGYFSHLAADSVTKSGIKFYAPLWDRSVRLLPAPFCIRTGSWQEMLMLGLMIGGMTAALFWYTGGNL